MMEKVVLARRAIQKTGSLWHPVDREAEAVLRAEIRIEPAVILRLREGAGARRNVIRYVGNAIQSSTHSRLARRISPCQILGSQRPVDWRADVQSLSCNSPAVNPF